MDTTNTRFILLPSYYNLTKLGLRYTDLLIYLSLRSFHNTEQDLCFPTYDSIASRAGVKKLCAMNAVKRLAAAKLIEVIPAKKKKSCNHYKFTPCEAFAQVPYSIFDASDLTYNQKAMLIALRQCFDSNSLRSMVSTYTEMAEFLTISYKTFYTQYKPLVKKGYIAEITKEFSTGNKSLSITLTSKINWCYSRPIAFTEPVMEIKSLLVG